MRALITASIAGLLCVGGITTAMALEATQEPTEVVVETTTTTTPPTTTVAPTTTTEPPVVVQEVLDLSGINWTELARATYGKCGEWYALAMLVGWPAEEWPTLSYVLHRESRCNIGSHNKTDPMSGSRGLMQINGYWCRPTKYSKAGWLQDQGILTTCDDLYNPEINLRAGLAIWLYGEDKHGCGWRGPWATRCP